jgi:hypothetical protein
VLQAASPSARVHRRTEPDHVAVRIDEHALMLTPFGVLREPHIASGRKPGPGQRASILDKQVSRRPALCSPIQVRLHPEMNLGAIKGDEAVPAAAPRAGTETKPAVIGKGSVQVTNRENRRYSRTHDCNLPARACAGRRPAQALDEMRVQPLAELLVQLANEPVTTALPQLRS